MDGEKGYGKVVMIVMVSIYLQTLKMLADYNCKFWKNELCNLSCFLKFADIDFSWTFLITGDDVECLGKENKQEED